MCRQLLINYCYWYYVIFGIRSTPEQTRSLFLTLLAAHHVLQPTFFIFSSTGRVRNRFLILDFFFPSNVIVDQFG